mmetsp:Transcript_2381/g.3451  ORF Transcript_2381/g.3451 Transcript_2381/m.3451 type:complete len:369 (-) Transcript_2381:315-1421(-)
MQAFVEQSINRAVENVFPPLELQSAEFLPLNIVIKYDVEIYKQRLGKAVQLLSQGLGIRFTFILEPAPFHVDELFKLKEQLDLWDSMQLAMVQTYSYSEETGHWSVRGFFNHILFDRRVTQAILDLEIPIEQFSATSPCLIKTLKERYTSDLFFKRIGSINKWALNAIDFEQVEPDNTPIMQQVKRGHIYDVFYDSCAKNLEGKYLLFIVKDLYHSEHQVTDKFHMHSMYGYFVRSVTFPCSREDFQKQVRDASTHYTKLFKQKYTGLWTLNDHSAYKPSKYFSLVNRQMKAWHIYLRFASSFGRASAGSMFLLLHTGVEARGNLTTFILPCRKPVNNSSVPTNWMNVALGIGAAATVSLVLVRVLSF